MIQNEHERKYDLVLFDSLKKTRRFSFVNCVTQVLVIVPLIKNT